MATGRRAPSTLHRPVAHARRGVQRGADRGIRGRGRFREVPRTSASFGIAYCTSGQERACRFEFDRCLSARNEPATIDAGQCGTRALFGTAGTSRTSLIRERSSDAVSPLFSRAVQNFVFLLQALARRTSNAKRLAGLFPLTAFNSRHRGPKQALRVTW